MIKNDLEDNEMKQQAQSRNLNSKALDNQNLETKSSNEEGSGS